MPQMTYFNALNKPKMFQNPWNLHQSSISAITFRNYEQKIIAVKNLATATHFPVKISWIPKRKNHSATQRSEIWHEASL